MMDKDLKLDSKYNIIYRVSELERRVSKLQMELEKMNKERLSCKCLGIEPKTEENGK